MAGSEIQEIKEMLGHQIQDDPTLRFVVKHWQNLLWAIAMVALIAWGYNSYFEARHSTLELNADNFANMREQYLGVISLREKVRLEQDQSKRLELQKQLDEAKVKLTQAIESLSDNKEPYRSMQAIYGALAALNTNEVADLKAVEEAVSRLGNFQDYKNVDSHQRFLAEIGSLILNRGKLDDSAKRQEGRIGLKTLAEFGEIANVVAALSFARSAITEDERREALSVLKQLKQNHPEQSDLLKQDIDTLG